MFAEAGDLGADIWEEATGVAWQVAMLPGKPKQHKHRLWGNLIERAEMLKTSVRAKVERPL